ncbi:cell division protein FtsB [Arthrobacter sp. PvP102]|jgi:cell division protein FtsB|uniref:FtsB family cell division protein n=1 Tax=unclassified Arthrobacter TaxID=235627 RepID=UPI001AE51D63|nr:MULTISPECIES: septum formation initiator family protein [unclassified Arthrobacter]MBP1234658.1 cell division protein FtsB [Arthrobacter sp. PvP103]MBP1235616.1 cell division protein FtsB [Arthrobacter sp. PvP102]
MATRRPKVPRATPAVRQSKDADDGAEVIRADFGATRHVPADGEAKTPVEPAKSTTAGRLGASVKAGVAAGKQAAGRPPGSHAGAKAPGAAVKDGADSQDPVPAKAFSGRMLALAVVMIAITIMLAPTVKIFIDKKAEIAALEADIAARKAEQDGLKLQVSRWQDPNYVKQQARDRINMVMPGETGYWVFGSDLPAGTASGQAGTGTAQDPANLPWVDSLWESIRRSATD